MKKLIIKLQTLKGSHFLLTIKFRIQVHKSNMLFGLHSYLNNIHFFNTLSLTIILNDSFPQRSTFTRSVKKGAGLVAQRLSLCALFWRPEVPQFGSQAWTYAP